MTKKSKPVDAPNPGLVRCTASDAMASGDLYAMFAKARYTYQRELADIVRILSTAERCANKGLRRLDEGNLASARRWLDYGCDAEYDALGECEALGWLREALGNECPWRVVADYVAELGGTRVRRLRVVTTCTERRTCLLNAGDLIRSVDGSGVVVSARVSAMPFVGVADGRHGAVVTWPDGIAAPKVVWKVDPSVVRCGFE